MTILICALAGLAAFACLGLAVSAETHKPLRRGNGLDRSTLWSIAALGLMLTAMGALASAGG